MCPKHYKRWCVGTPLDREPLAPAERFWSRVDRTADGCWTWTGNVDKEGYGRFTDERVKKSPIRAHRYAWMLDHGAMPPTGLLICHRCDNPPCVRPDHLFVGTTQTNIADKLAKGRARGNTTGLLGDLRRRLNEAQVQEIRQAPGSNASIGRQFGISREHVRRIKNGTRR